MSFTSVVILTLRGVGVFLKAQISNHLGKVLKMRDFIWVLLCGQRVNRVSSGLCDLCASLSLWDLLAPNRDTLLVGQMNLVCNTGKEQLLPCGVALCCLWGKPCA